MKKTSLAIIGLLMAIFALIGCAQAVEEVRETNNFYGVENSVTFTLADESPSGLIVWDETQNKTILAIDITCQETLTCTVYEMTFQSDPSILMYFPSLWLEDEKHNQLTEVVPISFAPEVTFIFSSNLEVKKAKRIYLVGSLYWASSPGQGALNSFQPILADADASGVVLDLPLAGNSLYVEYKADDFLYTDLSSDSPSGSISPGNHVMLMKFQAFTQEHNLGVNSITYWFAAFDGSLSTCTLLDNGFFNQQTNNIYYDDYSQGWLIVFYNWFIPMTTVTALPNIKEYGLTCNLQINSPNQTLQMNLRAISYLSPQDGINFQTFNQNLPMVTGNPLTIP